MMKSTFNKKVKTEGISRGCLQCTDRKAINAHKSKTLYLSMHIFYKIHFPPAHTSTVASNITKQKFEGRKVIGNGSIGIDMMDHRSVFYRQQKQCCFQNSLKHFQFFRRCIFIVLT